MGLEKYFNLDIDPQLLYGYSTKVIKGTHGISKNSNGEHFATAYHIYSDPKGINHILAKDFLRDFLNEKYPDSRNLTLDFLKSNHDEFDVLYENSRYPNPLKKIKLEWIVEMYEKETKIKNVLLPEPSNIPLSKLNIEQEIIPLLDNIANSVVFENNNNSHNNMINGIFDLIKNNHKEFEILALVYFPILFEKTCSYLIENSLHFKELINNYLEYENKKDKKFTSSYDYLNVLKYNEIKNNAKFIERKNVSLELFQDFDQIIVNKKFTDLYHFVKLRNNLIHKDFHEGDSFENINNAKKILAFILEIIEEYCDIKD